MKRVMGELVRPCDRCGQMMSASVRKVSTGSGGATERAFVCTACGNTVVERETTGPAPPRFERAGTFGPLAEDATPAEGRVIDLAERRARPDVPALPVAEADEEAP